MLNKRLTSLFFLFAFLFTNVGWSISVHYCQGEAFYGKLNYSVIQEDDSCDVEVINTQEENCCNEETENSDKSNHEVCCKDDVIKVTTSDQTIQKTYNQAIDFVLPDLDWTKLSINTTDYTIVQNEVLAYYIDANAPPLYKLYCKLIFYA